MPSHLLLLSLYYPMYSLLSMSIYCCHFLISRIPKILQYKTSSAPPRHHKGSVTQKSQSRASEGRRPEASSVLTLAILGLGHPHLPLLSFFLPCTYHTTMLSLWWHFLISWIPKILQCKTSSAPPRHHKGSVTRERVPKARSEQCTLICLLYSD